MKKINSLFIVFGFLIIRVLSVTDAAAQMQTNIPSPQPGGESFGTQVAVLPNGNFVVTDPSYDAGALTDAGRVYLYNGVTLAVINTITGSAANDMVGSSSAGLGGVIVLANGNYVVIAQNRNDGAGAVTFCSGTTGCPATISAANSLVGLMAGDFVGGGSNGVTALPNGNYVVTSPSWDNGATTDVGAVTFCSGTTGCVGAVSPVNSLVGSMTNDQVGVVGIKILSNNNYVVSSFLWNNGAATFAGAVTRCSGTAGCTGAVSSSNSLVGTTVNEFLGGNGDVFPLTNGGYVVTNPVWDNGATTDVGAATFCNITTGCTGTITTSNSLIGTAANDQVGFNGVTALTNGNYVVRSQLWDNGAIADAGATTFCSGTTGCAGMTVSPANSSVGSTANDGINAAAALSNGNYVSGSGDWDNPSTMQTNVGAVRWCNGTTGCTGAVSAANSLIGPASGESLRFATALSNGNYVVSSPLSSISNSAAGSVRWCSGTTGCTGTLTLANSLVGSTFNDQVGLNVTALTNGNYVVMSPMWNKGAISQAGAVTLCDGTAGCVGTVTTANSLTGSTINDRIGGIGSLATPLSNGNYLVRSGSWDNGAITDAGAVTLCSGTAGCAGSSVSAGNSLVGSTANDFVGGGAFCGLGGVFCGVTVLSSGNYLVKSRNWDNGAIADAGAVTYASGIGTVGAITASNSVRGTTAGGGEMQSFAFDSTNNQLVVGRPADNIVTVFRPIAPSAASVAVGGRVVKFKGRGIANARVTMIDANGVTRTALTNPFGYYRFADVPAGATYTFGVSAKREKFNQPVQVRSISEDTDDVIFVAAG